MHYIDEADFKLLDLGKKDLKNSELTDLSDVSLQNEDISSLQGSVSTLVEDAGDIISSINLEGALGPTLDNYDVNQASISAAARSFEDLSPDDKTSLWALPLNFLHAS